VRLFFAIFPDSGTRERIAAAAAEMRLSEGARRVPTANYHVTLAFLGEVARERLAAITRVGAGIRALRFTLRLEDYSYWAKAGVVVAGTPTLGVELEKLRRELYAGLERCGVELDARPFHPHVTVARKVSQAPVLQPIPEIVWTVRAFQLARSVSTPDGAIYTVVASWPLLDERTNRC
jgi:RNA 2',3'-cyclic 3'-phosphodiesterase